MLRIIQLVRSDGMIVERERHHGFTPEYFGTIARWRETYDMTHTIRVRPAIKLNIDLGRYA